MFKKLRLKFYNINKKLSLKNRLIEKPNPYFIEELKNHIILFKNSNLKLINHFLEKMFKKMQSLTENLSNPLKLTNNLNKLKNTIKNLNLNIFEK